MADQGRHHTPRAQHAWPAGMQAGTQQQRPALSSKPRWLRSLVPSRVACPTSHMAGHGSRRPLLAHVACGHQVCKLQAGIRALCVCVREAARAARRAHERARMACMLRVAAGSGPGPQGLHLQGLGARPVVGQGGEHVLLGGPRCQGHIIKRIRPVRLIIHRGSAQRSARAPARHPAWQRRVWTGSSHFHVTFVQLRALEGSSTQAAPQPWRHWAAATAGRASRPPSSSRASRSCCGATALRRRCLPPSLQPSQQVGRGCASRAQSRGRAAGRPRRSAAIGRGHACRHTVRRHAARTRTPTCTHPHARARAGSDLLKWLATALDDANFVAPADIALAEEYRQSRQELPAASDGAGPAAGPAPPHPWPSTPGAAHAEAEAALRALQADHARMARQLQELQGLERGLQAAEGAERGDAARSEPAAGGAARCLAVEAAGLGGLGGRLNGSLAALEGCIKVGRPRARVCEGGRVRGGCRAACARTHTMCSLACRAGAAGAAAAGCRARPALAAAGQQHGRLRGRGQAVRGHHHAVSARVQGAAQCRQHAAAQPRCPPRSARAAQAARGPRSSHPGARVLRAAPAASPPAWRRTRGRRWARACPPAGRPRRASRWTRPPFRS